MAPPIRPSSFIATASAETIARIRSAVPAAPTAMSPLPALSGSVRGWLDAEFDGDEGPNLSGAVRAFVELPADVDLDERDDDIEPRPIMHAPA